MMRNAPILIAAAALIACVVGTPGLTPVYAWLFPGITPAVYDRGSFMELTLSHLGLVGAALAMAGLLGLAGAIFATRPAGVAFRPSIAALATIGQTFPPAAVLALLVPVIGFGALPTLVALTLYGLLPITQNALAGFSQIPAPVMDAANGMGLSAWQILWRVELPLAFPLILAGLRTAAVIGLGTATIGSTMGALTLGTPIIDGLVTNKPNFILQGAIPLALLAILTELVFTRLDQNATNEKA